MKDDLYKSEKHNLIYNFFSLLNTHYVITCRDNRSLYWLMYVKEDVDFNSVIEKFIFLSLLPTSNCSQIRFRPRDLLKT